MKYLVSVLNNDGTDSVAEFNNVRRANESFEQVIQNPDTWIAIMHRKNNWGSYQVVRAFTFGKVNS